MKASRKYAANLLYCLVLASCLALAVWQIRRMDASKWAAGHVSPGQATATVAGPTQTGRVMSLLRSPGRRPSGDALKAAFLEDLGAALASIEAESDSAQQEAGLETLAHRIAATDYPAAIVFLMSGSELSYDLGMRLVRLWAESDPRHVAEWSRQNLTGTARHEALLAATIAWAARDQTGGVEWIRKLPDAVERSAGLTAIAYELASTQPGAAINLARELPANSARDELLAHAVNQWAGSDPQGAVQWASQVPEAGTRERLLAAIATTWAASDPIAGATLAVKSLSPGRRQADAVVGIVQQWVQREPEAAAAWVVQFPEGMARDAALENVVKLWVDRDPDAAGNWLKTLADGAHRDLAIGAYVIQVAPSLPASAAKFAESIGDESMRHRQMQDMAEDWLTRDSEAARTWITQADLPELSKARLLGTAKEE